MVLPMLLGMGCGKILGVPSNPRYTEPVADGDDAGITSAVSALGPAWSCVGATEEEMSLPKRARVSVTVCDFTRGCEPPLQERLTAKLCSKVDAHCISPLRDGLTTDTGTFEFDVPVGPDGFDGYLDVVGPKARCDDEEIFPGFSDQLCAALEDCDPEDEEDEDCMTPVYSEVMYFFNPPVTGDEHHVFNTMRVASLLGIGESAGLPVDVSTGTIALGALACDGSFASGVTVKTNKSDVLPVYMEGGGFNADRQMTDASGVVGMFNVPSGYVSITAEVDGQPVSTVSVLAAPSTMTFVRMAP